jgi:preprotein translocase subunit SecF
MKTASKLLIALLAMSGAMFAPTVFAYGAGTTTQPSMQAQRQQQEQARQAEIARQQQARQQQQQQQQARQQQQQQQQARLQQQLQQQRQAEAARQQQIRQEQARVQADLQAKRDAIARQQQRDAATARFVESRTFKTLEKVDPYGRVISRSLIACGTAGAATAVGGPVVAGVSCVGGAVLAN